MTWFPKSRNNTAQGMTGKFYPQPQVHQSPRKNASHICCCCRLPRTTLTLFAQSISIGIGNLNEEEERMADRETFILILQERGGRETALEMREGPGMGARKHKKATAI